MKDHEQEITSVSSEPKQPAPQPGRAAVSLLQRRESQRWWIKLVIQPALLLLAGAALLAGLGAAQKLGWLTVGSGSAAGAAAPSGKKGRYICPMLCTPPLSEPGRCPVCKMELVPATSSISEGPSNSIQIDPVARRLADIHTVAVKSVPFRRTIQAIGELAYDEGALKTIAAYVDGRLDRLYADYTGVVVKKGDHLALLYSPVLYAGQVELLAAKKAGFGSQSITFKFHESLKQKLLNLGMSKEQIDEVERSGKASSRMHLYAPISGTVIEKLAVEGQYVKEGQAIYKLADLSNVWLMLKMFPEDAAAIRYGQKITAEMQSLPGRNFYGRVAFIDPNVNRKTRTVGVRVVIPNEMGILRVGDYAKATINVPTGPDAGSSDDLYDSELAGKFISPRHPQVIESSPGKCRICGIDLVPAKKFGYSEKPVRSNDALVVPRSAVLMAGNNSVVYVETKPGRFEIRRVVLGTSSGDEIVIRKGVAAGEQVAVSGNFLIDSQMQLAGNPSLMDPTKAKPKSEAQEDEKIILALAKLSPEDRSLAKKQGFCPVLDTRLGSMGTPVKVDVNGKQIFICCEGCRASLLKQPKKYLAKLANRRSPDVIPKMDLPPIGVPMLIEPETGTPKLKGPPINAELAKEIAKALSKLSPKDQALAKKQHMCPVVEMPLGSMGVPVKVDINGRPVFICCEGCRETILAAPAKYLAKLPKGGGK